MSIHYNVIKYRKMSKKPLLFGYVQPRWDWIIVQQRSKKKYKTLDNAIDSLYYTWVTPFNKRYKGAHFIHGLQRETSTTWHVGRLFIYNNNAVNVTR